MSNWRNNPAYLQLDSQKQEMIEELFHTMNGKALTEALPVLSAWKAKLESKNIHFTKEENELLTSIFLEELTPEGRKQYEFLKPFLKQRK